MEDRPVAVVVFTRVALAARAGRWGRFVDPSAASGCRVGERALFNYRARYGRAGR